MKKITTLTLIVISLFWLNGCILHVDDDGNFFDCERGRGNWESREITLPDFSAVDLSIDADVYITQGEDQKVTFAGQSSVLNELDLRVSNGKLRIELNRCFRSYDKLEIHITVKSLNSASVRGSGNIIGQSAFGKSSSFLIDVSGSGDVSLELIDKDNISTDVSGSGNVYLEGNTLSQTINISGSGRFKGFDLISNKADVKISGSGTVEVFVSDQLTGSILGSGTISYKGSPDVSVSIAGSGSIKDRN